MDSHADLVTLANGINKLITGNDEDIVGAPKTFISGIASMLSDAGKEVTEAFGLRNTANPKSAESKMVSRACAGCGARCTGAKVPASPVNTAVGQSNSEPPRTL